MNKRHYEHTLPNIRGSLSNTYDGRRMETVEFSLSRMEVCQCRGKSNQLSAYHDRILNLVRDNIPLIRERMVV